MRSPKTTFITPEGEIAIRMTDRTVNALCDAAKTLKARYFVTLDDAHWGVFDFRKATKLISDWVLPEPDKVFEKDQLDAAVMWALHMRRT